jgi:hypothetical protein
MKPLSSTAHESFRAIARICRDKSKVLPRVTKSLMDPGAELNLIRKSLIDTSGFGKFKIHARKQVEVSLLNNGKHIGTVYEAVYLSFCLDTADGPSSSFSEWFHVWENMDEEMILGSAFCKEQGLTCFHTRLKQWHETLSCKQTKRSREVEHVAVAGSDEIDYTSPYEHEPLLQPVSKHRKSRERVITACERIDAHAVKHAIQGCQYSADAL